MPTKKQDHCSNITNNFFKYARNGTGSTNPSTKIGLSNFASDSFVVKGVRNIQSSLDLLEPKKNVQASLDLLVPRSDIFVQSTKKKSFRVV